jgi:hypothetical protein
MAISPSIRASGAPRQWCTLPRPKARCLFGSRASSRRVGILEKVLVVVGRANHRQDQLAARYRRSRDLYDLAR